MPSTNQSPTTPGEHSPATERSGGGFEVALGHLDDQIAAGHYPEGSKLPAERDLAAQLGVSRGAVREAIRVLQTQGILVSAAGPGNGTRVQTSHVEAIGRILRLHLALKSVSFADLTETRVGLERTAVEAAARHRLPDPLERAHALHAAMADTADIGAFNQLDTDFHIALAQAGDNQLASDLTVAIRQAVHAPILAAEQGLDDWAALQAELTAEHAAILAAVIRGDVASAGDLVAQHIRHAYSRLLTPDGPHRN